MDEPDLTMDEYLEALGACASAHIAVCTAEGLRAFLAQRLAEAGEPELAARVRRLDADQMEHLRAAVMGLQGPHRLDA
jgi:hypothetical protein